MENDQMISDRKFEQRLLKKIEGIERLLTDRLWAVEEWGPTQPKLQEALAECMNLKEVFNENKEAFHVRYQGQYDTSKKKDTTHECF